MFFLQQFLEYKRICIQCHDTPDADTLAAAFGVYSYFVGQGISVEMIYSGATEIKKFNIKYMVEQCGIPIQYVEKCPPCDLLFVVDGQYGAGNVTKFDAPNIAVVDHHVRIMPEHPHTLIKSTYQSCSTIVWELLQEVGFQIHENLQIALLYGLFTDTSSFYDLYQEKDIEMRIALSGEFALFEKLIKSNLTVAELMIASDAMQDHFFEPKKRFSIVSAIRCDQVILGVIGDFMIQVDVILANICYTEVAGGYQISIRSCDDDIAANQLAAYICQDVGSGGGHLKKAGGTISLESIHTLCGDIDIFEFIHQKMNSFIKDQ